MRLDRDQFLLLGLGPLVIAEQGRLRRAVNVGVDHADASCPSAPARPRGWRRRSTCRPRPCPTRSRSDAARAATRSARSAPRSTPGIASAACFSRASSAARSSGPSPPASTTSAAISPLSLLERIRAASGCCQKGGKRSSNAMRRAHKPLFDQRHCFSRASLPYYEVMSIISGLGCARPRAYSMTTRALGAHAAAATARAATIRPRRRAVRGASRQAAARVRQGLGAKLGQLARRFPQEEPRPLRRTRRRRRRRRRRAARPQDLLLGPDRLRPAVAAVHHHASHRARKSAAWSPASAATATRWRRASA